MKVKSTVTAAFVVAMATAAPLVSLAREGEQQHHLNGETADVAAASAMQQFWGDGSTAAGWPEKSSWVSFQTMFDTNANTMKKSCGWNNWGQDNTNHEIALIYSAIQQASTATGVDPRFILATIMQESKGCVRVKTSSNGVRNPGLMQDHNGEHTCNENGNIQYPCPQDQIFGMVFDGTAGTVYGDGLVQLLGQAVEANQAAGRAAVSIEYAQVYYQAARLYNSGSIRDWNDLNDENGATGSYVNDIANRLVGYIDA